MAECEYELAYWVLNYMYATWNIMRNVKTCLVEIGKKKFGNTFVKISNFCFLFKNKSIAKQTLY